MTIINGKNQEHAFNTDIQRASGNSVNFMKTAEVFKPSITTLQSNLNSLSTLNLGLHFKVSVFNARSRLTLLQVFKFDSRKTSHIKKFLAETYRTEVVTIKLVKALARLNLISSEQAETHENNFKAAILVHTYKKILKIEDSALVKDFDPKLIDKIKKYSDRAVNSIFFNNDRDAKNYVDALICQYYMTNEKLTENMKPSLTAYLLHNLISDQMSGALGGKYDGLKALEIAVEGSKVKVPRFIGLNALQIQQLLKTNLLPGELVDLMYEFRDNSDVKFMIRSSSTAEDKEGQANAGCFESVANVKNSSLDIINAIRSVNNSFESESARLQTALYTVESGLDASGAIIAQQMIGEVAGRDETMPVSGVALSPDPLSRAENTFNINASYGHGEGIVQGTVTTDETLGIIDPQDQFIHSKTLTKRKPDRLAPQEKSLDFVINERSLQYQQSLSQRSINIFVGLLNALKSQHASGVDIEFVAQEKKVDPELYIVQQRAQDQSGKVIQPSYVPQKFLENNDSIAVQIKAGSDQQTCNLSHTEIIVHKSLDEAFNVIYLGLPKSASLKAGQENTKCREDIKAVFVLSPANANAHAALMLRQQGIAIIEIAQPEYLKRLEKTKNLVFDPEHKLVFPDNYIDEEAIQQGRLGYPATVAYSLGETKTLFLQQDVIELELLRPCLETVKKDTHVSVLLKKLQQKLTVEQNIKKSEIHEIIAELLKQNFSMMQYAQSSGMTDFQHITHEIAIDIIRLSRSVRLDHTQLHHLLYLDWIRAGFYQTPASVPDATGLVSVKTSLQQLVQQDSFKGWIKAVHLNHAAHIASGEASRSPYMLNASAQAAINILYTLAQVLPPLEKQAWLKLMSEFIRNPDTLELTLTEFAHQSVKAQNSGVFKALIADQFRSQDKNLFNISSLKGIDHFSLALDSVANFSQRLTGLQGTWANHSGFSERIKSISHFEKSLDIILPLLQSKNNPYFSSIVIRQLGQIYEKMDLALKEIISSTDYTDKNTRKEDFKVLLNVFYAASKNLLKDTYDLSDYEFNDLSRYYNDYSKLGHSEDVYSLVPSQGFNVGEALIKSAVMYSSSSVPQNYGDLHTLLHQNIRFSLGVLTIKTGGLDTLPNNLINFNDWILKEASHILKKVTHNIRISLQNIEIQDSGNFILLYNIPLREHGLRLAIDVGQNKAEFHIALDGNNENNRYEVGISLITESKLDSDFQSVKVGKDQWINIETASPFSMSWTSDLSNPELTQKKLLKIIHSIVNTSFIFAVGSFFDNPMRVNRINRLHKLMPAYTAIRLLPEEKQWSALTAFVVDYLDYDSEKYLNSSKIPLHGFIDELDIKKFIQSSGLLDERVGLYEFDQMLLMNVLFNFKGNILQKDLKIFIQDKDKFKALVSPFSNFSSKEAFYDLSNTAQIVSRLMPELLNKDNLKIESLVGFADTLLRKNSAYYTQVCLDYMMSLDDVAYQNARTIFENTPAASMSVVLSDLDTIMNHNSVFSENEIVPILKKYTDISKLGWSAGDSKSLYAGSAPLATDLGLKAFFQKMIDLNITKIIDLRAQSYYDAHALEEYYPSNYYSTVEKGIIKVKMDNGYTGFYRLGLKDPLPLKIKMDSKTSYSMSLTAYRKWEDFSVISVQDLRNLGQILIDAAQNGENVFVHCAGGIGRTGTLTTYAQVKSAIDQSARPLSDNQKFIMVEDQIFANRQDRIFGSVETYEQFKLILDALNIKTDRLPVTGSGFAFESTTAF